MAAQRRGQHARLLVMMALVPLTSAANVETHLETLGFEVPLRQGERLPAWQQRHLEAPQAEPIQRASAPGIRHIREREALPTPIAQRRARYAALVEAEARRQGVDPELVHAVIRAESSYRPRAQSPAGARGLMQLMPATAKRFGVSDIWEPAENIRGGVTYLRFLLDRFEGNLRLVLAAYNAGEGAVAKYGHRIPPYPETRTYVDRVLGFLGSG
ncbi:MAG: lytic transglycosylase domain-containing protein [Lamprobacter sp.]|uniref:lytic transglycosylase domain-containing protein n=1 Tax=Lamprobacter sp. TaxID=3100796 RepID=UPI002B25F7B2|nr:lytic transglycosylase domain-containing protein [Lamprobacter sp.]MEA3642234.1 lytic transglycosylase domain-containing protein [Lamprobacter sp.]